MRGSVNPSTRSRERKSLNGTNHRVKSAYAVQAGNPGYDDEDPYAAHDGQADDDEAPPVDRPSDRLCNTFVSDLKAPLFNRRAPYLPVTGPLPAGFLAQRSNAILPWTPGGSNLAGRGGHRYHFGVPYQEGDNLRYFKRSDQAITIQEGAENISLELDPDLFERDGSTLTVDIYAHDDHRPRGPSGLVEFQPGRSRGPAAPDHQPLCDRRGRRRQRE